MANTYTQIHLQFIFAVKYRHGLIDNVWKNQLYKYITGIVQNNQHKLLAINGMPDHIHLLVGMRPVQSVSDLLQDIKADSSKWINLNKYTPQKFEWQQGYAAFSYSKSQLPEVISYIQNQEKHHAKKTFLDEYKDFLLKFGIDFDEKYIFKLPE